MEITDEQYLKQIILSFIFTQHPVDYKRRSIFVNNVARIIFFPILCYIYTLHLLISAQQLTEVL